MSLSACRHPHCRHHCFRSSLSACDVLKFVFHMEVAKSDHHSSISLLRCAALTGFRAQWNVRSRKPLFFTGSEDYEDWRATLLCCFAQEHARCIHLIANFPKISGLTELAGETGLKAAQDGQQGGRPFGNAVDTNTLLNNTGGPARQVSRSVMN